MGYSRSLVATIVKRAVLNMLAFLGSYFILYIIDPNSEYWTTFFQRSVFSIVGDCGSSVLYCFVTIEMCFYIDRYYNRRNPWIANPVKRLVSQSILQILVIIAVNLGLVLSTLLVQESVGITRSDVVDFIQWTFSMVIIAFMISAINTGNYMLNNWKKVAMEVAEHKVMEAELQLKAAQNRQAAVEAELQALKLQLDTHFVFNNLSVLSELILEDQNLGYRYAENFTKVYRYLLVNSKRESITLEEELKFIDSYIFLVKQRIGEGVCFEINIDSGMLKFLIPPLTVQLLIENALKHNRTLKENPLWVRIYTTEEHELVVENRLLPVAGRPMSAGVGLENIMQRYDLVYDRKLVILFHDQTFTVKVPLIA